MTYCTITAGICAGCDGELERVSPAFPDVRENYDMTRYEGHCWAYCTRCHEKIVYSHWEHDDYDEDDLPDEPLFFSEEEGDEGEEEVEEEEGEEEEEEEEEGEEEVEEVEGEEEEEEVEGVSPLWMGVLTLLAIGIVVL